MHLKQEQHNLSGNVLLPRSEDSAYSTVMWETFLLSCKLYSIPSSLFKWLLLLSPLLLLLLLHTYLLTPWCRVLPEQLTGLQLVKKFPTFHGTRKFITALTSVRHLSLSWVSPMQSIYPHPTSCRSILILSNHLRLGLPSGLY